MSKFSTQILFFQLENKSDNKHQDYILKAKQILDEVGKKYYDFITNYIIENELAIKQNTFISLESDENNIYLYDTPKKSIYNGGVVFPKVNKYLTPISFDVAFDSLISKTITTNNAFIKSLENGTDKLGFLRSKPTDRIINILKKDSTRNALLIPKNHKDEKFLEVSRLEILHNMDLEPGYLFSKKELNVIIESYKSVIPLIDRDLEQQQQRRKLYLKYKAYYKQLNELLFYKQLQKNNTIGELLEIKTGIKVRERLLNTIKISEVKEKDELSDEGYIKLMKHLRLKVTKLEAVIGNENSLIFEDGSKTPYYFVLEKQLF